MCSSKQRHCAGKTISRISLWTTSSKGTSMTIFWQNIGLSLVIVIGGIGTARAQRATVKLERLVETSARRIALARQVAFAKWDTRSQVEDATREAEVITAAVKAGQSRGLDPCRSDFARSGWTRRGFNNKSSKTRPCSDSIRLPPQLRQCP
jgi:chorismate mutase